MEGKAGAQAARSPINNQAGLPLDAEGKLMQRVVARRLAALERVADFLFAGQEAAWLRQELREWRKRCIVAWGRKRMCRVCGRLFICEQAHFSEYPGCEPPFILRTTLRRAYPFFWGDA